MLAFSDLAELFKVAFFCYGENGRLGLPLFFVSPPGESKTSLARQFMRTVGTWFGSLEGSRLDAVDVAGLPQFTPDGNAFRFVPPAILRDAAHAAPAGLLFLDELTRAPASVQAAFLTLLLEGRTEGVQLPETTRIWAAANPAAQVGGVELDPANASRLVWINWPAMSAGDWSAYLLGADTRTGAATVAPIDYAASMADLDARWDASMMRARGAVVGFMQAQGSRLREASPDDARAWANPRTWSMATRAYAACLMHEASHAVTFALVAGCIGEGNATAFLTWARNLDLPNARDVLTGAAALPVDPKRPDRTFAVLAECIAIVTDAHAAQLWNLVQQAAGMSVEIAVMAIRAANGRKTQVPALFNGTNPGWRALLADKRLLQVVGAIPTTN